MKPPPPLSPAFLYMFLATTAGLFAQDTSKLIPSARVLFENVVRKANGNTTTFRFIEPPAAPPVEAATTDPQKSMNVVPPKQVVVSAQVYEGSLSEVAWDFEGCRCVAWSSVDFGLLQGVTDFEAGGERHRVMALAVRRMSRAQFEQMLARRRTAVIPAAGAPAPSWPVFPASTLATVPPGITAWYALVGFDGPPEMEERACASMEALHAYVESNRAALEARQAAALQAARAAPAKAASAPAHTIIQVWPLNEEQIEKRMKELGGDTNTPAAKEEQP